MSKTIFAAAIVTAFLQTYYLRGSEAFFSSRTSCFENHQPGCHEDFVDVYKNLSRSTLHRKANTFFMLFTRKNPEHPENLHKCGGRLPPKTNFNPKNRLILICLSYRSTWCKNKIFREIKTELLKKEDCNVLVIDYGWQGFVYIPANMKLVAKQSVVVLRNIMKETGIERRKIIAIGFSLGAQMAGYIGQDIKHFERIIGIDPAGPLYQGVPNDNKLSMDDANFVEVWHCAAGQKSPFSFGTYEDVGHVNFYINGGNVQTPCYVQALQSIVTLKDVNSGFFHLINKFLCYHSICLNYFLASINIQGCEMLAIKCKSYADFKAGKCSHCGPNGGNCLVMGFDTDRVIKEIPAEPEVYFLETSYTPPYCKNDKINLEGYADTYNCLVDQNAKMKNLKKGNDNREGCPDASHSTLNVNGSESK